MHPVVCISACHEATNATPEAPPTKIYAFSARFSARKELRISKNNYYIQHQELSANLVGLHEPFAYASRQDLRFSTGCSLSMVDAADERQWRGSNALGQILTAVQDLITHYY
ncbi:hypothetical protein PRIPAC_92395 [Pristionchus pacificus]|uniref:Uncharacterized protein n=1 Tax=Pristionchus pacificus TaxID=54126 RepID=A0A2A6BPY1_PRIPA|nr:hypothetical protein PRIPAC_92395 [Pristionchus pacificus]|eukprot:PDM67960.1 hypothetical protein PRIPAC_46004 [Pristionchus pacificus]